MNFTELREYWQRMSEIEPIFGTVVEHEKMYEAARFCRYLCEIGWQDITYCPKDGTKFLAYCFGWHKPDICTYSGTWPNGGWWLHDSGDLWPVYPSLWRHLNKEEIEAIELFKQEQNKDKQ